MDSFDFSIPNLVLIITTIDIIVAFVSIIRGFSRSDMSFVFSGAFCGLTALSNLNDPSVMTLIFAILGMVVGVGNFLRKGFRDLFY